MEDFVYESARRGKPLRWLGLSRRLLWMAAGHELIEPELLDWIDTIPKGEVLYDVGASNGIFALYASASGASVYAFEPDSSNYFLLAYNNYLNSSSSGCPLKGCFNMALSDKLSTGAIHVKNMELGSHEKILDKRKDVYGADFEPAYSHAVVKFGLDELPKLLNFPLPMYLKIDVDGSEVEVLAGCRNSLLQAQSVFIELTTDFIQPPHYGLFDKSGLTLTGKHQVQNYDDLYNCIFDRV
jgi:FkbM family methyltransferase